MQSLSQRKPAILECNSSLRQHLYALWSFNRLFLNVICHLDNTSMPYDPFYSADVRAEVCNQNAIFNVLFRNSGLSSTQVITGQLCIFNKNLRGGDLG